MNDFLGTVGFTAGYDAYTEVVDNDFPFRIGILTQFDIDGSHVYPWELCRIAFNSIENSFQIDKIRCSFGTMSDDFLDQVSGKDPKIVTVWKDLLNGRSAIELIKEDQDFPDAIVFECNAQPVIKIYTEFWDRIGGPSPYHDSTTLSCVSSSGSDLERIKIIFQQSAEKMGIAAYEAKPVSECIDEDRRNEKCKRMEIVIFSLFPFTLLGAVDILSLYFKHWPTLGDYLKFKLFGVAFVNITLFAIILNGPINAVLVYLASKYSSRNFSSFAKITASLAVMVASVYICIMSQSVAR